MIRVVLVDDQTLVRRGIRSLLELAGDVAIVAEAADGEEGMAAILRERPDVVLLDLRMPRKNGLDVLRELTAPARCLRRFCSRPLTMMRRCWRPSRRARAGISSRTCRSSS